MIERFYGGECSPEEKQGIIEYFRKSPNEINDYFSEEEWNHFVYRQSLDPQISKRMLKAVSKQARIMKQVNETQKTVTPYLLPRSRWWAAAASVLFLLGTFSYFIFFNKTTKPTQLAKVLRTDVQAPQLNKATTTLANGKIIFRQ